MIQDFFILEVKTSGQKLYDFTNSTIKWIKKNNFKKSGLPTVMKKIIEVAI